MKSKYKKNAFLLFAILVVGSAVMFWAALPEGWKEKHARANQCGTIAEVIEILGPPETTGIYVWIDGTNQTPNPNRWASWEPEYGWIAYGHDPDGKIVDQRFIAHTQRGVIEKAWRKTKKLLKINF